MALINYDYFEKIDIRTGRITRVESFPQARNPSYKLWIDFGSLGVKKSSAQITRRYSEDDLLGRLIIAVVNFPPRQIADFISEVLVLGAVLDNDDVALIQPDAEVPLGSRVL